VISLHQAGIENVVASGGTSLTQDQLRLIKKYTNNLTIIYDGDAAGVKAALRGLDMALEESLNVKLVLIPDKEDPDSYVRKVGMNEFRNFILHNKKDFIYFQLEVALKDAGNDASRKAEVVNKIAETVSKVDKAEDFTRQQEYIRQCSQMLHIDEAGFTNLVNKFIRNRISLQENKLPFDEAKIHEENAQKAEASNFDDNTFSLLFKDDLQEKEVARILLEHGNKPWEGDQLIAQYILSEVPEDDLIDNKAVIKLMHVYREHLAVHQAIDKSFFVYNTDPMLSTLAVSLLQVPFEQSEHWKRELSNSAGYQQKLFKQDVKTFYETLKPGNEEQLLKYLKIEEDKTSDEVEMAVNYLKLRKVKRMILQNQTDMEKATHEEYMMLIRTHMHLKEMEKELTTKMGSVIIK
jgi:DNA primase